MSVRKIYASTNATANAAASLQVIRSGRIVGIVWVAVPTGGFAASTVNAVGELSRTATAQYTTNDTLESLDQLAIGGLETTSGNMGVENKQTLCDIPITAGDRLYLHATHSGTGTVSWTVFLHIRD